MQFRLKYISAFFLFLCIQNFVFAQFKIQKNELASDGKNYVIGITYLAPKYRVQLNEFGTDILDFRKLKPNTYDTIRFLTPENSRYAEKFPETTLAMHSSNHISRFFQYTDTSVLEIGVMGDILGLDAKIYLQYDTTSVYLKLPIKIGDSWGDTTTRYLRFPYYEIPSIDSIRADIWFSKESEIVGQQRIITPYAEYECLLEKQTRFENIRAYKHHPTFSWSPFQEISRKELLQIYRWHNKETGYPIAEAVLDRSGFIKYIQYQMYEPLNIQLIPYHNRCYGDKRGAIDLQISGGVPDYKMLWSNGSTDEDLFHLPAGDYSVTVTDNNGLQKTARVTIEQPNTPFYIETIPTNISCKNARNGNIKVNIHGGTPDYLYEWTDGVLTLDRDSLRPGTYVVYVQDKQKCLRNDTVLITEPAEKLAMDFTETIIKCHQGSDGAIEAFPHGGTPPYKFHWHTSDSTKKISNLKTGIYHLQLTDKNGCMLADSFELKEPRTPITLTERISDLSCFGSEDGNIRLTVRGGKPDYDIYWNNGQTLSDISKLQAGNYWVEITDQNRCVYKDTFEVKQPDSLQILISKTNVRCFDEANGKIELNIKGGTPDYRIRWNDNNIKPIRDNLKKGIYTVLVEDKKRCTTETEIEIIGPQMPLDVKYNIKHIRCKGQSTGMLGFDVIGGKTPYTFLLNNDTVSQITNNLAADIYQVLIVDALGCKHQDSLSILEPVDAITVNEHIQQISCSGKTDAAINLNLSGGEPPYTVLWNDSTTNTVKSDLAKGMYEYIVTDKNGCNLLKKIKINEPRKIEIGFEVENTTIVGNTGAIQTSIFGGSPPYKLTWNDQDSVYHKTNLKAGEYTLEVTDKNMCTAKARAIVKMESSSVETLNIFQDFNQTSALQVDKVKWLLIKNQLGQTVYNNNLSGFIPKYHLQRNRLYILYYFDTHKKLISSRRIYTN